MKTDLWITLVFALAVGCGVEELEPTIGCTSTSDCDFEHVCERPTSTCVPEPKNAVKGAFTCPTYDHTPTSAELREALGSSEIVGSLDDVRLAMFGRVVCVSDGNGLTVMAWDNGLVRGQTYHRLGVQIRAGEAVTVGVPHPVAFDETRYPGSVIRLEPPEWNLEYIARVPQGAITFDDLPRAGTEVSGYLELELERME